jgi:hypothetical protein
MVQGFMMVTMSCVVLPRCDHYSQHGEVINTTKRHVLCITRCSGMPSLASSKSTRFQMML